MIKAKQHRNKVNAIAEHINELYLANKGKEVLGFAALPPDALAVATLLS
jgi:hypothetical protein